MGNVNGVEMLHAALASRLPGVQVTVETPQQPNGSWWIDVYLKGKSASVEWRPAHGYGVAGEVTAYGEGPEQVFKDATAAAMHVAELLSDTSEIPSKDPEPVVPN